MPKKCLGIRPVFSGITIGGSGEGHPLPLVIVTGIVMVMAFFTVYDALFYGSMGGVDLKKSVPFKCKDCGGVFLYKIGELQKMQKPMEFPHDISRMDNGTMGPMMPGPMMGPMVLDCPKCKKHALTQAVECPKCKEIFVMKMPEMIHGKMDMSLNGVFDDKCPRCGESYAKAWQEKYRQEKGE